MTNRLWQSAIERAESLTAPLALDELPDAELHRRFVLNRDEDAYAALVRRHGPLVWCVCRSLLSSEADAEDAFQATFLVLVRSAKRVNKPNAIGAWLHTVAGRVCRNILRALARRKKHERNAAIEDGSQPIGSAAWDRWQAIAYEEIGRLPETLRVPFVLCVLQGIRQPDAARQLGWKLGTISGRLCKAKQALTDALAKRGVAAGILASLGGATMPLSTSLGEKGIEMLRLGVETEGPLSTSIHELARGAMGGIMTKTKLLATALVVGALAVGVGSRLMSKADAQSAGPGGPPGNAGSGTGAGPSSSGLPGMTPGGMGMPGASSTKVEYLFDARPEEYADFRKMLINYGKDGWEYVGLIPGTTEMIFKRVSQPAGLAVDRGRMGGGAGTGSLTPMGSGRGGSRSGGGARGGESSTGGGASPNPFVGPAGGSGASSPGPAGPPGLFDGAPGAPAVGGGMGPAPRAKPPEEFDLQIGETIRYRVSARHSIDRILSKDAKIVEVSPDPTDATKVLIKALSAGTAKVELTDALGAKGKLTIRVK